MGTPGQPKTPGSGRKRGTRNRVRMSGDLRDCWQRYLESPRYRESLMKRIEAGGAIHVETWLLSKIFGRPEIRVEVTKPDPAKAQLLGQLRALSKAERMQLAELARKAIAGATFGSSPSGGGPSAVLPAVSPVTGKPLPALPAVPATPVDRAGA